MTHDFLGSLGLVVLGSRLKRAGTLLQNATQTWLHKTGYDISSGHLVMLAVLDEAGTTSLGAVAKSLGIAQPGVSRMAARLEAEGLVASAPAADDKRVRMLELTPAGCRFVADAKASLWPVVQDAVAELCADLGGSFIDQLAGFEEKLSSGVYEQVLKAHQARRQRYDDAS